MTSFKDENPNAKNDSEDTPNDGDNNVMPIAKPSTKPSHSTKDEPESDTLNDVPVGSVEGDETTIIFRQRIVNPDGTVGEKVHGPMPRSEWPEYEKEHGL